MKASPCISCLFLFLLIVSPGTLISQETVSPASSSFKILFYNTGNFFDVYDDSLKEDDEFLPEGLMRWNYTRYKAKLNALYKVIIAAGGWEPPALICLSEVENRKVLNDLIFETYLAKFNYALIHYESPDPRGIDLAILYRRELVDNIDACPLVPKAAEIKTFTTRQVIYSRWKIDKDTIHLFLNHWPSRRGGVLTGEPMRKLMAEMIAAKCDSIFLADGADTGIIIGGDFNSTPDDAEIQLMTARITAPASGRLINLSEYMTGKERGSYKYRGTWELLDQIIISESILKGSIAGKLRYARSGIYSEDFLLTKDRSYNGYTPFGTYAGYRYIGGFSDHLPVFIDLVITPGN